MTSETMQKLDAQLAEICTDCSIDPTAKIPVVIRVAGDRFGEATSTVAGAGGTVRHQFRRLGAIAAWVPLAAIEMVAQQPFVSSMEMQQQFSMA